MTMPDIPQFLLMLALTAFLASWIFVTRRWTSGVNIVSYEPRRPVPWGIVDVVLTVVALILVLSAALTGLALALGYGIQLPIEELGLDERAYLILAESLSNLVVMTLSLNLLFMFRQATWRDVGWDPTKFWRDARLGLTAFLMLAPVVYALQFLLTRWFESKHPLVELLSDRPEPTILIISFFSAVVVAPIVEEFFFRVLLQGWLERLAGQWTIPVQPDSIGDSDSLDPAFMGTVPAEDLHPPATSIDSVEVLDAYLPPQTPVPCSAPTKLEAEKGDSPPAIWPVLVSSLLFALLHFSHGPDWIPLFFFAVGLGYLYRQTHRIWPCIFVHALLNGFSMTMFIVQVLGKD
jgi:membrane protease YdiL (CAAX protease family)